MYIFFNKLGVIKESKIEELSIFKSLLIIFINAAGPTLLAFFIGENVISVISLFTSILCPYFMIICPSKNN